MKSIWAATFIPSSKKETIIKITNKNKKQKSRARIYWVQMYTYPYIQCVFKIQLKYFKITKEATVVRLAITTGAPIF